MPDIGKEASELLQEIDVLKGQIALMTLRLERLQELCGEAGHPGSVIAPITVGAVVGDDGSFASGNPGDERGTVRCPTCRLGYE